MRFFYALSINNNHKMFCSCPLRAINQNIWHNIKTQLNHKFICAINQGQKGL